LSFERDGVGRTRFTWKHIMDDVTETKSLLLHPEKTEQAFVRIRRERVNQDRTWGEQNHTWVYWLGILMEEVGELAKAIIERDSAQIDAELTQVAAVAVSMMEYGQRKGFSTREGLRGIDG